MAAHCTDAVCGGMPARPPPVIDAKAARLAIVLVASVQFYANLEGSMLLPLGPLLALQLHFPVAHAGYLNAAFLVSAAIAGVVGSLCLDRFDRRNALAVALAGLALGTAAAGFADSLPVVLACRVLAGLCGGPAISLGLALIGDVAPPQWRGRAMGAVSAGSSVALILGVPIALVITDVAGWRGTFFIVGGVGLALAASAALFLPAGLGARTGGGGGPSALRTFADMLRRRENLLALANGALIVSSVNAMAINLAGYFIYNLGAVQGDLKYLWSAGGLAGLCGGQACGRLADRFGPAPVLWGMGALASSLYFTMFFLGGAGLPAMLLMCVFLVCASGRIVLSNTVSSLTPPVEHRARFMSLASAANQAAAAVALTVGAHVLAVAPSGALLHMDVLAGYAIVAAVLSPAICTRLARLHRARRVARTP